MSDGLEVGWLGVVGVGELLHRETASRLGGSQQIVYKLRRKMTFCIITDRFRCTYKQCTRYSCKESKNTPQTTLLKERSSEDIPMMADDVGRAAHCSLTFPVSVSLPESSGDEIIPTSYRYCSDLFTRVISGGSSRDIRMGTTCCNYQGACLIKSYQISH